MIEGILVVLGVYLVILVGLFAFQRKLLFFPDRTIPHLESSDVSQMSVASYRTADNLSLNSWYKSPPVPEAPVLVYFHGNAGHIGDRGSKVRPFLDAGFGVLLASYRGYGGNPGRPSEKGLLADGAAALAFLDAQGVVRTRIVLYGESLGSGVAVALAGKTEIGAVILEAPFTSVVDVGAAAYPWVPVRLAIRDRFDSLSRIANISAPILVVHGELDRTVPIVFGRRLLAAASEPKSGHFFPFAGHNDLHDHGAIPVIMAFLARYNLDAGQMRGD